MGEDEYRGEIAHTERGAMLVGGDDIDEDEDREWGVIWGGDIGGVG